MTPEQALQHPYFAHQSGLVTIIISSHTQLHGQMWELRKLPPLPWLLLLPSLPYLLSTPFPRRRSKRQFCLNASLRYNSFLFLHNTPFNSHRHNPIFIRTCLNFKHNHSHNRATGLLLRILPTSLTMPSADSPALGQLRLGYCCDLLFVCRPWMAAGAGAPIAPAAGRHVASGVGGDFNAGFQHQQQMQNTAGMARVGQQQWHMNPQPQHQQPVLAMHASKLAGSNRVNRGQSHERPTQGQLTRQQQYGKNASLANQTGASLDWSLSILPPRPQRQRTRAVL